MTRPNTLSNNRSKFVALAISTALATTALGGCTTQSAPLAEVSAGKAQKALAKGKAAQAISHTEAAVLAEPRNAAYRAMLGATYMEAGRFYAAATSFDDAMSLGDNSPRTALSLALAKVAVGDNPAAMALLNDWRDQIAAEDLGLALALAGQPDQGVRVLSDAIRLGPSTAKLRQNLAYAFALQGNWRSARLMAAEDIPADKIDARIGEWAQTSHPEQYQQRLANLLQVPVVGDTGQPVSLALSNHPSSQQLAAEASALVPAPVASAQPVSRDYAYADSLELPPLGNLPTGSKPAGGFVAGPARPVAATPVPAVEPATYAAAQPAAPENFQDAFSAPAPTGVTFAQVANSAVKFASNPVVQRAPVRYGAEAIAPVSASPSGTNNVASSDPVTTSSAAASGGNHLVQLGSFSSEQGARRAWGIYAKRYPQLSSAQMVITEARVRGKKYYRVSAGGFASSAARSVCSTVKARGQGCFAWADGKPLPGALSRETRMARR